MPKYYNYAQDTDLNQLDVYIEDDIDNSSYFNLTLPEYISYGKKIDFKAYIKDCCLFIKIMLKK